MSGGGFIKLHRSMLDWEWFTDGNTLKVFLYLLLAANYSESKYRGHSIERGQVVFGRDDLAKRLKLTPRSVRTALEHLKTTGELTIKTTNKFSVGTIVNYGKYQDLIDETDQQNDRRPTNDRPATDQQSTTSKKNKKERKEEGVPPDPSDEGPPPKGEPQQPLLELGEFRNLKMTAGQLTKLQNRFPNDWQQIIDEADGWIEAKSFQKRYTNWYAFARNWGDKNRRHEDVKRQAIKQVVDYDEL